MIIVLVKYVCKRGLRERFLHEIQNRKIDVLSREEKGNSRYEYSNSILDDDTLILTELWIAWKLIIYIRILIIFLTYR